MPLQHNLGFQLRPSLEQRCQNEEEKLRNAILVDCCFLKLKQCRGVAARYEKTANAIMAMITVAAIALWLR